MPWSMRGSPHPTPGHPRASGLTVALLLISLMIRGLIPSGWMPNAHGMLHDPLVICTGAGPQLLTLETPAPPAAPRSSHHHDVCAFAGHVSPPVWSPDAGAVRIAFVDAARRRYASAVDSAAVPRNREQAARAPPIRV